MLILIYGLPGSGKSYLGERLASKLDLYYINTDKLRDMMKLRGRYSEKDTQKVYEQMFDYAQKHLESGKSLILDATFRKREYIKIAEKMASAYGVAFFLIEMLADEATSLRRVRQARKYSEAGEEVYYKLKKNDEPVEQSHLRLDSSSADVDSLIEEAMNYISHDRRRV